MAFKGTKLHCLIIPPSVKVIPQSAFYQCQELTNLNLPNGLEMIDKMAFQNSSLPDIVIPPSVKVIPEFAFRSCARLTHVELSEGLERIEKGAFHNCSSLHTIYIPSSVNEINEKAFTNCSNLTRVRFCEVIEQFVSGESMMNWWNHGTGEKSLSTYRFLVQCNVPERVRFLDTSIWQSSIHGMLGCIPSISAVNMNSYFDSIDSKLFLYENLKDVPTFLELAINQNSGTVNTNTDDILNTTDIITHVLTYLTEGLWEDFLDLPNSELGRIYIKNRLIAGWKGRWMSCRFN
jgi:hypothetical protein